MIMNCEETIFKLNLYIDGELDRAGRKSVDKHISECSSCARVLENERKLDVLLKESMQEAPAAAGLAEKIFPERGGSAAGKLFRGFAAHPKPVLVSFFAVILLAVFLFPLASLRFDGAAMVSEAAASHADFLRGEHALDLVSGDVSEISRWMEERLGFGVKVPDLSGAGFRPAGARLCRLGGRKAGCAVYERDGLYVSLFMVDAGRVRTGRLDKILDEGKVFYSGGYGGHNCVLCLEEGHGSVCLYVSDLPDGELMELARSGMRQK